MRSNNRLALLFAMVLLLGGLVVGGATSILAQEEAATPGTAEEGRPAHIHTGTCDELGGVVAPLTTLTAPTGASVGSSDFDPVEYSFSTVPMSLDTIVAADHAINVHESQANVDQYIACGNLGGTIDANGSLVIGLHELNGSGYTGVAVLTPNVADPASTDVSTFITEPYESEGEIGTPEA